MKYALNISNDCRILSVTKEKYAPIGSVIVDTFPDGDVYDYLYVNGEFIYDPIIEEVIEIPTQQDRIEA